MPAKSIFISPHARFEMRRRGIGALDIVAVVRHPGQVVPAKKRRQVFQSKLGIAGRILLRVVVKEEIHGYHVITAYKTSKVNKYWRSS